MPTTKKHFRPDPDDPEVLAFQHFINTSESVADAIDAIDEIAAKEHPFDGKHGWMVRDEGGVINSASYNVCMAMKELGMLPLFAFNAWTGKREFDGKPVKRAVYSQIKMACESHRHNWTYVPTREAIVTAVDELCRMNPYNPAADNIRKEQWDGFPRLAIAASLYFGCDIGDSVAAGTIKSIIEGVVVRALHHTNAHYPYIPILYSKDQGRGKTDALDIIAPGGKCGDGIPLSGFDRDKRVAEKMNGVSVVELPEVRATTSEQQRFLRGLTTVDTLVNIRAAYAEDSEDYDVRCVFVWTTNDRHVLGSDEERRHPFVECGADLDLDALEADKHQLWAEAAYYYDQDVFKERNDRQAVRLPKKIWQVVVDQSANHAIESPVQVALADYLNGKIEVTSAELHDWLRIEKQLRYSNTEFSSAMQSVRWEQDRVQSDGKRVRGWKRAENG